MAVETGKIQTVVGTGEGATLVTVARLLRH